MVVGIAIVIVTGTVNNERKYCLLHIRMCNRNLDCVGNLFKIFTSMQIIPSLLKIETPEDVALILEIMAQDPEMKLKEESND